MHLHFTHRHILLQSIKEYLDRLSVISSSHPRPKKPSAAYKQRRNKAKHEKTKIKRQQFTITRPIDIQWKPRHIKPVLQTYHLTPARILEVHNCLLTIQFNNQTSRDIAETTLPDDIFDAHHFQLHFSQE